MGIIMPGHLAETKCPLEVDSHSFNSWFALEALS
jgi:hypothetical protein